MTLSEVMHVHIPTLFPESTFRDAVDKMDIYQFPALVIVDDLKHPLAVVTEGDLSRAIQNRGDVTGLSKVPAIEFATKDPKVVSPDLEVSDALHMMLSDGITLLPIVVSDRLVGVVLRCDLMQALLMDVASPLTQD